MQRGGAGRRRGVSVSATTDGGEVVRKHRPDYLILLFTGLLMMIGLITMYAIGPSRANVLNNAYGAAYSDTYFFFKQFVSVTIALAAFAFFTWVPYKIIRSYAIYGLYAGFALCVLLFIVGNVLNISALVPETLGAYRWFNLGPLGSFQPSELLKFGILLFGAGFLGMRARQGLINDKDRTLVPLGLLMGAAAVIIILFQKDLGTGISLTAVVLSMLVVSHMKTDIILKIIAALAVGGLIMIAAAPHRMERVATFMQGDAITEDSSGDAYHIKQARIAIGTGGLFGLGIGNSIQATGYLPEAINDSVFAILGETFGFVGLLAIMALFVALLFRLLRTIDKLQDMRMRLIVAGVFGWIAAHVIMNIAAMTGLAPLTGITLPLLSYGGTSMMFIGGALGLVFQLSRYTSHGVIIKEQDNEDSRSRRGVGRTRYASRRSIS